MDNILKICQGLLGLLYLPKMSHYNVHTFNPIYLMYIDFSLNPKVKNMLSNKIFIKFTKRITLIYLFIFPQLEDVCTNKGNNSMFHLDHVHSKIISFFHFLFHQHLKVPTNPNKKDKLLYLKRGNINEKQHQCITCLRCE